MINVEAIVKVMRADLPAHFDKAILASELDRAKNWYRTRSKLDKWPKREKIIGQFIKDTERYRAALEAYSEAGQDIPLPFRLPSWLNTEAFDDVVTEAKASMQPDQKEAHKQAAQKFLSNWGSIGDRQSIFYWGRCFRRFFANVSPFKSRSGPAHEPPKRHLSGLQSKPRDKS